MAEIALQKISKRFGSIDAVNEISLTIDDGEFIVLLGPTGAGKTTTLRLVAGLEIPDSGSIRIAGEDVTALPIASRDVAFVFQQYSLYPHYTVYENMAFPLRSPLRRQDENTIKKRVAEIAELLRIESKLGNKATQLSGGEMQRVAIGRALVREPAAFLMDEPLSSLDAKLREDLRIELKRIQADLGATILYVSHDQVEAMTLADRIGVLAQGRLVQVDTPRNIYTRPETVYVAQRLGSPPINLLAADIFDLAAPPGAAQLGVRPEDIVLGESGKSAKILQIEHLGAETVVLLELGADRVHALMHSHSGAGISAGRETRISIARDAAMFFDRDGRLLQESV